MNNRANWVDYGKGIAIIFMVYTHLLSSAYHAGIEIPDHFFALSDSIIHGFLMPVFFFLSGLFVEGSFRKRGAKDYLRDKFLRIYYPYLIWSILQVSIEVMFSDKTRMGATTADLLAIPYRPWGQFWFLYALLLMHVTYTVFRYFGKYAMPLMFVTASVIFFYPIPINAFAFFGFRIHFIFFLSGIALGKNILQLEKYEIPLWSVILSFAALFGSAYFIFEKLIDPIQLEGSEYRFYFLYLAILGIVSFSTLSQYLARKQIAPFLQALGTYTIQIYLVHMLAGVGIRMILLYVFGIENWVAHILIGVIFVIATGIFLQKMSDRLNFPYLFELRKR
jgi:fucose 4-O-acetylase-like acetyltransferase